jgi:hypothetical protein
VPDQDQLRDHTHDPHPNGEIRWPPPERRGHHGDVTKPSLLPTLPAAAPVRAARQQRVAAGRAVVPLLS